MSEVTTPIRPLGANLDPVVRDSVMSAFGAAGADLSTVAFDGAFEAKRADGISFFSLRSAERDFIRAEGSRLIKSRRGITLSGVLAPIKQRTGICNGCSFSMAAWLSWVYRFVNSGTGPVPREVSFAAAYLGSRAGLRGDNGAYPSHAAKLFHDLGILPIDAPGKRNLREMTTSQQEDVAIWLRDDPVFEQSWLDAMSELRCRVMSPRSSASLLDAISAGYAGTTGMSVQCTEPQVGSNGISGLYRLNGGHETALTGWGVLKDRVFVTKAESWGDFPADSWPGKRIVVQTDGGPVTLAEGECAIWLDQLTPHSPELWNIGYASSVV